MKLRGVPLITILSLFLLVVAAYFFEKITAYQEVSIASTNAEVSKSTFKFKRLTLVNFWATWCPPCIEEMGTLELFYRQIKEKKLPLDIIAISVDENKKLVDSLLKTFSYPFTVPIQMDLKGTEAKKMGTTKLPETYLVNSKNEILYKWVGPQDWTSPQLMDKIIKYF
jgi:thiol-disulfide isomerase/thioredoxin